MKVALFVTCLADHYFAEAAADTVRLLRHLGCEVTFPDAQTCCGQPAYNAGMSREAARMAHHTMDVFADCEAVVLPSGSCATMVKRFYPRLAASNPAVQAAALADRTFELGEFIVRRLGVTRLGDGLAGRRVALHQGCHALRELRLETEPAALLEGAGAEVVPWAASDECCGFGGLFSVKMTDVSAAMADRKLDTLPRVDCVVSGDGGCILHLDGRSRIRGCGVKFVHLATALWRAVDEGVGDGMAERDHGGRHGRGNG
ncbi:MAG: (Fe-S)-binding protein [Gemmatimonadota bacterium]|nr:(Fe-S)-binding protein [Gemmatimonadota bacterium]